MALYLSLNIPTCLSNHTLNSLKTLYILLSRTFFFFRMLEVDCVMISWTACTLYYPALTAQHIEAETNGRHFADDIFKCIFLNENVWIPIEISLKFVPKGPINNIPTMVQVMAWRRPGDKPLSAPMMASLPTHIRVTQWVHHLLLDIGSLFASPVWIALCYHLSLSSATLRMPWAFALIFSILCHFLKYKYVDIYCLTLTWRWHDT